MQYFVRIIEFLKHHLTKGDETAASWVNGIDSFEYFTDVIDRVARMKPKSPVEQYRELLPDKWKNEYGGLDFPYLM